MTQAEFAKAIGASQGSVSKWESGREQPRHEAIAAIAGLTDEFRDEVRLLTGRETPHSVNGDNRAVMLVGSIEPSYYRESPFFDRNSRFPISIPTFGGARGISLQAWHVASAHYTQKYRKNDVLFSLMISETNRRQRGSIPISMLRDGETVIVSLRNEDLYEVVLRRFDRYANGSTVLSVPDFSDEVRHPPVSIDNADNRGPDLSVIGVAVGAFSLEVDPDHMAYLLFDDRMSEPNRDDQL